MPSKTQTRVDIPLNAAISIDVCIICGRPAGRPAAARDLGLGTRPYRNLHAGTGTVNVKYTPHTYTGTNAWGFPQEISLPILPSFPFQSTQNFPSNVLFKL